MIGKTVSHYKILAKIGAGGMGVVYRARDLDLDRDVALKFLPPDLVRDDGARKRFVHEAKAAASLDHPNICTVHEIHDSENETFIAMALVEGHDLRDRVARGALPVAEALDVTSQVSRGLARAHKAGIVHRDIKPGNILITEDGVVKIVDFGLARVGGDTRLTRTGTAVGTVAYMSPEQARGGDVDERSDVWAAGAVLYEMLTGRPPFRGQADQAVMYSLLKEDPEMISEVRRDVPAAVEDLVERALEKDPSKRPQSASELLAAVEEQSGRLKVAPAPRRFVRWRKFRRNRRVFYGSLSAAVLALAMVAVWLALFSEGDRIETLAVLPLVNQSGDAEQDYFVDGMTVELISQLLSIGALAVKPGQSTARYRNSDKPPAEIAAELGVDAIVEGSVRRSGDLLRITVRLIDGRNDELLWSEDYDRKVTDVFTVQRDVALNIAAALQATLTPEEAEQLDRPITLNTEAHELYLRGMATGGAPDKSIRTAIRYFERAIELDPDFAHAWFQMAWRYAALPIFAFESPVVAYPKARELLNTAVEINPAVPGVDGLDAFLLEYWERDFEKAERAHRKALKRNPLSALEHARFGFSLMKQNRCDEAVAENLRAAELEPRSEEIQQNTGEILYYCRRYEESAEASRIAIEMNPNHEQSFLFLAAALHELGRHDEAVVAVTRAREGIEEPEFKSEIASWIGATYGLMGMETEAREVLAALKRRFDENEWESDFTVAAIHFSLGENDEGFEWLERAWEAYDARMGFLYIHPVFDGVKDDPRYLEWCRRMKFDCQ